MKCLIVCNWKMHPKSLKEAKKLLEVTKKALTGSKGVSVIVTPPSLFLQPLSAASKSRQVTFGAQNVHSEAEGAHTGEISAPMVKDVKAQYVLVGHAERRAMGESNDEVRRKVSAVLASGLTPILCIGEKERSASGDHFSVIREQLLVGIKDVPLQKIGKMLIAYEPVRAIGATRAMSAHDMHEMSIFIRKTLVEKYRDEGHQTQILYGGAIDAQNAAQMVREAAVRGLLVGRASANPESVFELIKTLAKA